LQLLQARPRPGVPEQHVLIGAVRARQQPSLHLAALLHVLTERGREVRAAVPATALEAVVGRARRLLARGHMADADRGGRAAALAHVAVRLGGVGGGVHAVLLTVEAGPRGLAGPLSVGPSFRARQE